MSNSIKNNYKTHFNTEYNKILQLNYFLLDKHTTQ